MAVIVSYGAGLGGTDGKIYLDQEAPPQLSAVLYLSLAALLPAWRVRGSKGGLERCPGRPAPDPAAFLAGLAALLRQLKPDCWQVRCPNMQAPSISDLMSFLAEFGFGLGRNFTRFIVLLELSTQHRKKGKSDVQILLPSHAGCTCTYLQCVWCRFL